MEDSQKSQSPAPPSVRAGQVASTLDDTDRAIITELRRDGRLSVRALAERLHVSRATAYSRLERLHREQVITGYAAQVDPDKLGLSTAAHISVTIEQGVWREVLDALAALPGVEKVAMVGADFDMLVEVRVRDNHELRDVVLGRIQAVPGVRATRTWLVFEEWSGDPR